MNKNFLKTLCVKENATVKQVLNKLQKLKIKNQKFCLVSNSKNKIIDVLTDGDIRRILLKTDKLDAQIKHFLKKKFFYSREKNLTKNKKFLKLKKIKFLPILNQDNSLKDIIFLDNINDNIENEIFIFAGEEEYNFSNNFIASSQELIHSNRCTRANSPSVLFMAVIRSTYSSASTKRSQAARPLTNLNKSCVSQGLFLSASIEANMPSEVL